MIIFRKSFLAHESIRRRHSYFKLPGKLSSLQSFRKKLKTPGAAGKVVHIFSRRFSKLDMSFSSLKCSKRVLNPNRFSLSSLEFSKRVPNPQKVSSVAAGERGFFFGFQLRAFGIFAVTVPVTFSEQTLARNPSVADPESDDHSRRSTDPESDDHSRRSTDPESDDHSRHSADPESDDHTGHSTDPESHERWRLHQYRSNLNDWRCS